MVFSSIKIILPTIFLCIGGFLLASNTAADCIHGNCVNGQGTYAWRNGDKYVGGWRNGKRHGEGIFIWPEGDRYVGNWKNDKNYCQGSYIYPAKAIQYYVDSENVKLSEYGCITGDCVNGYGTYIWFSGAKYVGNFKEGKSNGFGSYTFPNGPEIKGGWIDGRYAGKSNRSW